jgi:ferrous iron transport protein A
MNLAELTKNKAFRVLQVTVDGEIGKRLSEMGFTNGAEGLIVRKALFGDPIQVNILSYNLSLRKAEAAGIEIELVDTFKKKLL